MKIQIPTEGERMSNQQLRLLVLEIAEKLNGLLPEDKPKEVEKAPAPQWSATPPEEPRQWRRLRPDSLYFVSPANVLTHYHSVPQAVLVDLGFSVEGVSETGGDTSR